MIEGRETTNDGSRSPDGLDQCDILDVSVAWLDWPTAFKRIDEALGAKGQTVIAFLNANNANIAMRDPNFREALSACTVLPDGIGVDIAAKALYGKPFPANLNGTDFIPALLSYVTRPLKVALLGARPDVLHGATAEFRRKLPWHNFVSVSDGYFDKDDCETVLSQLAEVKPDVLLVAMGSPTQELWIQQNIRPEHGKVVFSVGGLFDFVSENTPRAPQLVRTLRSEWIYRLFQEPRRMWRRYILGNPLFLYHVLRYKMSGSTKGRAGAA
ncbi:MAG: WecB/TagA/CpsF family glycosyltransferase [Alphaproteobacteria bacterium]|nr:WecB/TagA/CpsF family glycosyltransferase [Alphaproteobacteria bacterium]